MCYIFCSLVVQAKHFPDKRCAAKWLDAGLRDVELCAGLVLVVGVEVLDVPVVHDFRQHHPGHWISIAMNCDLDLDPSPSQSWRIQIKVRRGPNELLVHDKIAILTHVSFFFANIFGTII